MIHLGTSTQNSVGNNIYTDLILTRYPEFYDERSGTKNNPNLNRFENLVHYNMAEHVNSLQDAVMAIQRTMGEKAQLPVSPKDANNQPITSETELRKVIQKSTVKSRLDAIESKDWYAEFDKRYGGPNWKFDTTKSTNPTIQQHRHIGGGDGMPAKIVLTQEVSGLLPITNIDLSQNKTGITGNDIYVDANSPNKISAALNDKLSESTGGTIKDSATLNNKGKTQTRWSKEFDYKDAVAGNAEVQDAKTLLNRAVVSGTTQAATLLDKNLENLYHGRYVAIVRLAASALPSTDLVQISAVNSVSKAVINTVKLAGTDFETAGNYKTFYLIFDHDGKTDLKVQKLNTTASAAIRFDYALVQPTHPAVFDR